MNFEQGLLLCGQVWALIPDIPSSILEWVPLVEWVPLGKDIWGGVGSRVEPRWAQTAVAVACSVCYRMLAYRIQGKAAGMCGIQRSDARAGASRATRRSLP